MTKIKKAVFGSILSILVLVFAKAAWTIADETEALDLFFNEVPFGADSVSIGNAATALPDYASVNPAVLSAGQTANDTVVTANVGRVSLGDKGVDLLTESIKLPVFGGKLAFFAAQGRSGSASLPTGNHIKVDKAFGYGFSYAKQVSESLLTDSDKLHLGVTVTPEMQTKLVMLSGDGEVTSRVESRSRSVGTGILYQPTDKMNIGGYYERRHTTTNTRTELVDLTVEERNKSKSGFAAIAASLRLTDRLTVVLERQRVIGQGGYGKTMGGAEYCVSDAVCGYAGYNGFGATAGIGVYSKNVSANIGYTTRVASKDAEGFIGKTKAFLASLSVNF